MQNLKSKSKQVIIGWLLILVSYFGVFFLVNLIPSKLAIADNSNLELTFIRLADMSLFKSEFVSSYDNLNRVDVLFKNPNLESRDQLEIVIRESGGLEIYRQLFSGFNFGDTSRARLDFQTITNSKDRRYIVEILPTKIVDGKLAFGTRGQKLDMVIYYKWGGDWQYALSKTGQLMQKSIIILPVLLVGFLVW
ncbi:MAG: hypothetical protein WCV93_02200 [Candidatus Shapirobacteria bacterium]